MVGESGLPDALKRDSVIEISLGSYNFALCAASTEPKPSFKLSCFIVLRLLQPGNHEKHFRKQLRKRIQGASKVRSAVSTCHPQTSSRFGRPESTAPRAGMSLRLGSEPVGIVCPTMSIPMVGWRHPLSKPPAAAQWKMPTAHKERPSKAPALETLIISCISFLLQSFENLFPRVRSNHTACLSRLRGQGDGVEVVLQLNHLHAGVKLEYRSGDKLYEDHCEATQTKNRLIMLPCVLRAVLC